MAFRNKLTNSTQFPSCVVHPLAYIKTLSSGQYWLIMQLINLFFSFSFTRAMTYWPSLTEEMSQRNDQRGRTLGWRKKKTTFLLNLFLLVFFSVQFWV